MRTKLYYNPPFIAKVLLLFVLLLAGSSNNKKLLGKYISDFFPKFNKQNVGLIGGPQKTQAMGIVQE